MTCSVDRRAKAAAVDIDLRVPGRGKCRPGDLVSVGQCFLCVRKVHFRRCHFGTQLQYAKIPEVPAASGALTGRREEIFQRLFSYNNVSYESRPVDLSASLLSALF